MAEIQGFESFFEHRGRASRIGVQMRSLGFAAAMIAVFGTTSAFANVQSTSSTETAAGSVTDFARYIPRATALHISSADAPKIDGDLSDVVWARAEPIDQFYQVQPVEGATPSEPTRAYILYDEKNLYIGVYAYDSNPEGIRRSQMQRDPALQDDDSIKIVIDSFGSFRDGYFFGVNPNGARRDALIENNNGFRDEWNTIWRAKTSIVDDGWIVEIAIPFQSISFDSSLEEWNLQISRLIRRHNEDVRWSNIDQNYGWNDVTNPGRLSGLSDVRSGVGLEVQTFVTGAGAYDWETDQTDFSLNPSGNAFYKVTPSLTASLTVNTDFSDTGLDARQVNTGRFSLFLPETRDFFLQDAAVFEFGGRIFTNGPVNGLPFFTRNIGIVNGQPVDIVAGAKLSGKLGPANVGVISTRTGASQSAGVDGQFLSAARVSLPVLSESKVGLVFTNGDPTGASNNTVAGADFQYKKSNVFGNGTIHADAAYVQSFNGGNSDHMFVSEASYRSQKWNSTVRLRDIGEGYAPLLGFANRTGIRRYTANFWRTYRPANSFIRFAETGAWTNLITDRENDERLDHYSGVWVGGGNNAGDELWLNYERGFVDIREPFSIAGEVPVAMGQYRWNQYDIRAIATNSRTVGAELQVRWGGIYDGDLLEIRSELSVRPSRFFEVAAGHEYLEFDLPSGEIGIHIASFDSTIAFTPDMTIKTEVQYDNISEAFTFFSRFSWEPVPEREIFLSFGHTAIIDRQDFPRDFVSQGSSLALRLGHTFRM